MDNRTHPDDLVAVVEAADHHRRRVRGGRRPAQTEQLDRCPAAGGDEEAGRVG